MATAVFSLRNLDTPSLEPPGTIPKTIRQLGALLNLLNLLKLGLNLPHWLAAPQCWRVSRLGRFESFGACAFSLMDNSPNSSFVDATLQQYYQTKLNHCCDDPLGVIFRSNAGGAVLVNFGKLE